MNTPTKSKLALAVSLTLGIQAGLVAQTAPAAENENKTTGDDTVNLNPFVVTSEKDNGYIAVDSLAGGRTNTPIKYTPTVMSSLTRTFIDDVNLTSVRDALKWSPNVIVSDYAAGKQLANPFNNWDFNFRSAGQSLQGGAGPTRNYFTYYGAADTYNISRIEFDRGPNSILFGVGTVGGVLSTYTKMPDFGKDFTDLTLEFNNFGRRRAEVDVNYRLSDKVAMRVNAVYDHNHGWRKGDLNKLSAGDIALTFKPTDSTTIRLEGETSSSTDTLISSLYNDGISKWDGTSVANTWGAAVDGGGTRPSQSAGWWTSTYNVWIPSLASKGVMNWNGGTISAGIDPDGIPVAPRAGWYSEFKPLYSWMAAPPSPDKIPVLPSRDFTYGHGISKPKINTFSGSFEQRFTRDLDLLVSAYHFDSDQTAKDYEGASSAFYDLNKQLPDGSTNPNFGKLFGDFFLSRQTQRRRVNEIRAQLNYHIEGKLFGANAKQLFSASAGDQKITWYARQDNAQLEGTGITDAASNMVWGRLYFDNPNELMNIPNSVGGKNVVYKGMPWDWFDFDEDYNLKNVAAVSHTRLFDDRLSILAGVRNDRYHHHKVQAHSGAIVDDSASGTTYSAGGIYYFKWLGLFANYSKNFDPIGPGKNNSLEGKPFGPSSGKGTEVGVRISTDDGKYYASISRYDSKSKDRIFNGGKPDFAGIWRNYYDALGQTRDQTKTNLSYDDTEALKVSGYEVDITANPTKQIRISANFGKPDSEIGDALPGARAYFAANEATWTSATSGTSQAALDLKNSLQSARNTFQQNTAGKIKLGRVDYTASVFVNYTFTQDTVKGLSIGGGVAVTGRQYVGDYGAPDGQPKFAYYGDSRRSTSLVIAYETKINKSPVRFALNVDNVLNDKDPIITGYHWGWTDSKGHNVANSYELPTPISVSLSARVSF